MATDNIFSGLKVVDLASFIAGPGAATILSDFGAEVIKIEPPGSGRPLQACLQDAAPTQLAAITTPGISTIATNVEWRST